MIKKKEIFSICARRKCPWGAKGSCAEMRTQIYIGIKIGYIDQTIGKEWIAETEEISAMLTGLMKYLNS